MKGKLRGEGGMAGLINCFNSPIYLMRFARFNDFHQKILKKANSQNKKFSGKILRWLLSENQLNPSAAIKLL